MGRGWQQIATFTIRQRLPILLVILAVTVVMWLVRSTEISYDFNNVIPANHPELLDYQNFKKEFGEDGNLMVVAMEGNVFDQKFLSEIYKLTGEFSKLDGVEAVISLAKVNELRKDTVTGKFQMVPLMKTAPTTQAEADSFRIRYQRLPFYEGLFTDSASTSTVIGITFSTDKLNSDKKIGLSDEIMAMANASAKLTGARTHFSGLPAIRSFTIKYLPGEMRTFFILSVIVTAIVVFAFFRSILAVFIPLLLVAIVVVWTMGIMGIMGYKITHVISILPALITVIGIPNVVYLITKYHFEYKRTQNKMKSLVLVIQKIGVVTVIVNANTAIGFFTLIFTKITILVEFGIVGTLSVIFTFFISIVLVPIICSYLPSPNPRQVKHIDGRFFSGMLRTFENGVQNRRWIIYSISILVTGASVWGCIKLNTVASMVDDLPRNSPIHTDLQFFEQHYGGVMPFEIIINTHKKDGINDVKVLKKVDEFQKALRTFPEVSRSISILDAIKFGRQAWLNGSPEGYQLPSGNELLEISALKPDDQARDALGKVSITDSLNSKIRIKANIADVGSVRMKEITDTLSEILTGIFITDRKSGKLKEGETYRLYGDKDFEIQYDGKKYSAGEDFTAAANPDYEVIRGEGKIDYNDHFVVTGTTKIFLRSNDFLVSNLAGSLIWALVLNAILMAILFRNIKMVVISFLPNIVPLVVTAGIMGFMGLDLKPSTALIFSISFGITVDNTIHYLARYRYARRTGDNIRSAISNSFKDTGLSMIYTSIILFFGFVIFTGSSFGGTVALGLLTSITLVIALFANLLILPALIITFYREDEQLGKALVDEEEEEENIEVMKELIDAGPETENTNTDEKVS